MQFGYAAADSIKIWTSSKGDQIFLYGELSCNNQAKNLSQCVITTKEKCSHHSLLKCHICARPLLNDTKKFPDSLFSASKAINLHNAANARISSGRSWCAPTADGNHYLQISFEKLYAINSVAIFGDTTTLSWVTKYHINTTSDLINWESVSNQNSQKVFKGNKNAYKDAAISNIKGGTRTRALRLIPVTYNNRPCIRVELYGGELLPSSPTGLNITYSASRYVIISWMDPQNIAVTPGTDDVNPLIKFRFILRKQMKVILNKTEPSNVAKPYMLSNLIPNTMYTVVVTAGNSEGFGDAASVSFKTKEDGIGLKIFT
ncbi:discoidin-1 subunit B/C-like [Xenia sp. Carnegie-2017]|uniref:discoidin-1 subunit B/C-like n=1 Tax=Xenia sp. Carnegie-2017 TaxID=2897299 RepID=UPI001F03539B|nr:discoidin-1 subunit B/C-like [Xenia sp. Carnegie-2017]